MIVKHNANDPQFVDTTEAYSKSIFVGNNRIAIPYINIGLMPENPINAKQSVVDYSYYIITGVQTIFFNGRKDKLALDLAQVVSEDLITEYIITGGYVSTGGAEVIIRCKERWLYLLDTSELREPLHPFVPRDTPRTKRNMDAGKVEMFFSFESLPEEIKILLGKEGYSLTWQ